MKHEPLSILIIGLGLIGGSMAKALKGFYDCNIYGVDADPSVLSAAENDGAIRKGYSDLAEIAPHCRLNIICIRPEDTFSLLQNAPFSENSLVTDVCGVKEYLLPAASGKKYRYIGGHPMAGRECGGYWNSDPTLFQNACYLLTPAADALGEDIVLLKEMAAHIGCRKTVLTTPQKHDQMVAYTSQLMHVVAAALCDNTLLDQAEGFSAGSLRDCTRVAKLDSKMWTQLFLANRAALTARINEFEHSLNQIKSALKKNDANALQTFLETAADRKRRYLSENTPCESPRQRI